jgi:hypothetical protein
VADREFVFSNPDVQRLIREKFVPLAMDDWYLRRQNDPEGRFFREMTRESPRGNAGDATRQGRYVFTASGRFLGFNNNRGPERLVAMLEDALAKWEKLPDSDRKTAGPVSQPTREARYDRRPPSGGAVVKVHTRVLERAGSGKFQPVTPPARSDDDFQHRGFGAAVDHLWLTADDLKALVPPAGSAVGKAIPVPPAIAQRIARYHLVDGTRGEPPHWSKEEAKTVTLTLTPASAGRATLAGEFHMETKDGSRGFQGTLTGWIDTKDGALSDFTAVATGNHWGESPLTKGARPGKSPIGFAFRLCPQPGPADSIPPQAARWLDGYYDPARN